MLHVQYEIENKKFINRERKKGTKRNTKRMKTCMPKDKKPEKKVQGKGKRKM